MARSLCTSSLGCFFFSSRRRHTRLQGDWSSDVCSSDLNGVQVASKSSTVTSIYPGTSNLLIGSDTSNFFNGLIDEAEVFNRALTTTEVAEIGRASCRERV